MNRLSKIAIIAALCAPAAALANSSVGFEPGQMQGGGSASELPPYMQCVPFARQTSGIEIYGDANTWWQQAAGLYQRGGSPRVGAVMVFTPYRNMRLGHVATVTRVIDSRTVLLSHANWSPINGRRGQVERDVRAIDVSPGNDWSEVRVWYDPIHALGKTRWPVAGFIYNQPAKRGAPVFASAARKPVRVALSAPAPARQPIQAAGPSRAFSQAFASGFDAPAPAARPRREARRDAGRDVVGDILAHASR